jgi:agmatine deiminase
MKRLTSTPKKDGYRMPGEFEPHDGCYIIWPERPDNWRLGAKPAQKAFAAVAGAIANFEPVTVCVSKAQYDHAVNVLPDNIRVVEMSSNDSWIRDSGPTFVKNESGSVRGVDWEFNAWGGLIDGLYFPWDFDDRIAHKVCELERIQSYRSEGFILEGGSIHTDGEGTLFTTEECLLSEGRNPSLSREEIEGYLQEYLGIEKVIWLKNGIYNDETNGHVDNILCVVKPGTVLLAWTDDESDPQYSISAENLKILEAATDAKGRKLEVLKLILPQPVLISEEDSGGVDEVEGTLPRLAGDRLAASYVNFYIANGGIVYPLFGDPQDEPAGETLKAAFPGRQIVGVPAREILLGGGNIHCITQQLPQKG